MGKIYRNLDNVDYELKDKDNKLHRAKHYHPQLKDDIKQEIIQDRKLKTKARRNSWKQQRNLKQVDYDTD